MHASNAKLIAIDGFNRYRIDEKFHMVQTFALFTDDPTTTKTIFHSPVNWYHPMHIFVAKIRTVKLSSGVSGGMFVKVCASKISHYMVRTCMLIVHVYSLAQIL